MTKVLRLHKGASNTISNWDSSVKIGTKAIDSILDPIGATDRKEITSIPSPFARIDLVKRAFKIVAEGNLEGKTAYHKLVSDCLDVGQIFFNIEKYRDKIEIIVWDKYNCLRQLENSEFEEHRRLGKTYKTYLEQDCDEYNFDKMDCIYLLNYIDPSAPNVMNIIGATSPATIFFTSANNLEYVGKKIKFGNDIPFDSNYEPLYNRNFEYIKYWWSLKYSRRDFSRLFPEVNLYLEKCFRKLGEEQKNELRKLIVDEKYYIDNYEDISVQNTAQQYVMLLDSKLRRKCSINNIISGFEMLISDSMKKNGEKVPLVLPVDTYTEPTIYVSSSWNKNTIVPYVDERPISERTLPDDGAKYPYVTIGDFLEDTIIKVPYKLNSDSFFDGNDDMPDATNSFILPIKTTYFNYFSANDLTTKVCGKNRIEIRRLAGAVKVILRIPIKDNGYIQYEKLYYEKGVPDSKANKGFVIEREFTLGLFPSIKYPNNIKPFYRVALLDRDSVNGPDNTFKIDFFDYSNEKLLSNDVVRRNRNADGSRFENRRIDTVLYAFEDTFQYMHIENDDDSRLRGIVIPKFQSKNGSHQFRFAIDFGTTNTHVEYSIDGGSSKPFDILDNDMQIQKLHKLPDNETDFIDAIFDADLVPETIGNDSLCSYPMRTVLSESNNINWTKSVLPMAHVNIPFTYAKCIALPYNVTHTDLKWSTKLEDKQRASKYIECLLLLLRNKVLLNNGSLAKTEIIWFYPASMTQNRFNKFEAEWQQKFENIFGAPKSNIITISESIAPYYYHKNKKGATSTVVSIDIGGGTTDVLIVDKGTPKFLTSFRCAANSIFGDGYSYDSESNGFILKYKDIISDKLETNNLHPLTEVLESTLEKKISTDVVAFIFSLANNKEINKQKIEIDFNKMLSDDGKCKYPILIFYVAVMYHVAIMMKAKGLDMPRHITFSGNGSKILNVLSPNDDTLVEFTKIIFEQIYGENYPIDGLDIIRPANSKESTCKGGILMSPFQSQSYTSIKNMKTILVGSDSKTFVDDTMTYKNIPDKVLTEVVSSVSDFVEFTFSLDNKFSFYDNFELDRSILFKVKDLCMRDIKTYLENGLSLKKNEIIKDGAGDNLEETLFFYPIVGMINAVVRNMYLM